MLRTSMRCDETFSSTKQKSTQKEVPSKYLPVQTIESLGKCVKYAEK